MKLHKLYNGVLTGVLPAECRQERVEILANTPWSQCMSSLYAKLSSQHAIQHSGVNIPVNTTVNTPVHNSVNTSVFPPDNTL